MAACGAAALAGLAAGCVAIAATVAVERLGGVAGGLIATLPTTIVPAAAGLAASADFPASMNAIPSLMLVNAGVLLGWRWLPPLLPPAWSPLTRVAVLTAASVLIWAAFATLVVSVPPLHSLAAGVVSTLAIAALGVALCTFPIAGPKGGRPTSLAEVAARGVAAGVSIAAAVGIGSISDVVGGVVATFPSIFLTTMIALALAHGEAVPLGATGTMVLGSTAVAAYALLAAALVPAMAGGEGGGPLAAALATAWFVVVAGVSGPSFAFVRWRQAVVARGGGAGDSALLQVALGRNAAPGEDAIDREFESELAGLTAAGRDADDDADTLAVIRMAAVGGVPPPRRAVDGVAVAAA